MESTDIEKKFIRLGNRLWDHWGSHDGFNPHNFMDMYADGEYDEETGTMCIVLPRRVDLFCGARKFKDAEYPQQDRFKFVFPDGRMLGFKGRVFGSSWSPAYVWQDTGAIATIQEVLYLCHMLTIGSAKILDTTTNTSYDSMSWYRMRHDGEAGFRGLRGELRPVNNIIWQVFNGNTYAEERFLEEHIYDRVFHAQDMRNVHKGWVPEKPVNPCVEPGFRWFGTSPYIRMDGRFSSSDFLYGHCLNCGKCVPGSVESLYAGGGIADFANAYCWFVCDECRGRCDSCGSVTIPSSLCTVTSDGGECNSFRMDFDREYRANECVCFNCGTVYCALCAARLNWGPVKSYTDLAIADCPVCGENMVYEYIVEAFAPYFTDDWGWYGILSSYCPNMYSGRLAPMTSKRFVGFWNSLSDDERRNFIDSLYASRHKGCGINGSLVVDVLKRMLPVRGAFVG